MELTHIDREGKAKMVDVGDKKDTHRIAVARGSIRMNPDTLQLIKANRIAKGNVLTIAQIAGIQAAKQTSSLIPLSHPIFITEVTVSFEIESDNKINIEATAKSVGKTGVELEAMVAVSIAGLTIYDMCKAVDKGMTVENIYLYKKSGGKSGDYIKKTSN